MSRQTTSRVVEKLLIPLAVAIISAAAIITAALITSGHLLSNSGNSSPTATPINTVMADPTSVITATPDSYVQLHSFYSGTASGYADGSVTFTLQSEDQQGNVSMQTTFQQLQGSQEVASYSCQGSVTLDRHIMLQCSNIGDPTYVLTIQGTIYSDGHMEGTETATNTNDSGYHHVYYWKVY